jgi:hypothetical protein
LQWIFLLFFSVFLPFFLRGSGLQGRKGGVAMSDEENKDEKELDLSSQDVVTKYKCAAEIANSEKTLSFCPN